LHQHEKRYRRYAGDDENRQREQRQLPIFASKSRQDAQFVQRPKDAEGRQKYPKEELNDSAPTPQQVKRAAEKGAVQETGSAPEGASPKERRETPPLAP
jgi:hypothetical protein